MAERNLNTTLKKRLINNEPFAYAHLIKYERPYATLVSGKHSTDAKRYAYLTDATVNIVFNDGSYATDGTTANGNQTYIADKIYKVGSYSETSQAKATGMTLELGAESLNNSITASMTMTTNTITASSIDFVTEGFREGDKISITDGTNDGHEVRITGIKTNNTVLNVSNIDSTLATQSSAASTTLKIISDELKGPLLEMNDATLKSYHNRDVFIYKVFLDPDDYTVIGAPILVFKGIISSASLKEDPSKNMRVSWKLTSHWGDFAAVNGRWTNDDVHRALNNEGDPQPELALKEVYANDLGFQHADITMHILATYKAIEKETRYKKKKILFGLLGSTYRPYEVDVVVEREVDLNWALSAKYIPVVYGVDRVPAIPIFVDTKSTEASNIYIVYAIAEGEVGGLYDLYIEDEPLMCSNKEDSDDRDLLTGDSRTEVDVVCRGRADKGETLGGESMSGASTNAVWPAHARAGREGGMGRTANFIAATIEYKKILAATKKNLNSGLVVPSDGSGVIDGQTISITKPNTMYLTFHSGRTDQLADNTLVTIAEGDKFKRQADYFADTGDVYWGPNHTLSDTAYVVLDCEIAEDATTVPEIEYVVRGKYVDSYNYDFSYLHDPTVTITGNEGASHFSVGDTVDLKNSSGTVINNDVIIIDKWTMYGPNGVETRFRFSDAPELGYSNGVPSVTSFYMENGSSKTWYMVTYNHIQNSGTVPSALTASATTTTTGQVPVITFASDPGWTTPFPSYKSSTAIQLPIAFMNDARNYVDLSFPVTATSATVLTMTGATNADGFVETGSYGEPVIRTDAIKLATSASDADNTYNDMIITLTIKHRTTGDTTEHIRKIIDYDGGTETAQVDRVWDQGKEPYRDNSTYSYTYSINTIADRRVSINPATQLLDYMTSQTYGKRLDIDKDIALSDWLLAARTCDSRGTQTLTGTSISATAGDRYILQKTDSTSSTDEILAMGRVQSTVSSSSTVVMEECFGKFSKTFMKNNHVYAEGDIIQTATGYYKVGSSAAGTISTEPTHTSGTTSGLTFQANVTIRKLGTLGTTITLTNASGTFYSDYTAYSIYNSDFVKFWRYLGWEDHNQRWVTRHQLCGVVDTANPVFDTINGFLMQFNGLLSYEAGLYVLRIETTSTAIASDIADSNDTGYTVGSEMNVRYITNDDIIGSIKVTDPGPKKAYNTMTSTIGDPGSRFQGKQVSFYDSNFLKTDKMVIKSGTHTQPACHSYFNARINVENALKKSRFGMKITFKVGPKALLLLAGETIGITYDKFEWSGKKFRISNILFNTDCTANITATEYDDSFYTISPPKLPSLVNNDVRTSIASVLGTPNNLDADAVTMGNIDLTWVNGSNVAPANTTEIWVASSNQRATAKLLTDVFCVSSIEQSVNGAVSNSTSVTLDSGNDVLIGQLVTGTGISGTVTVAAISGTGLTLSSAQTIADGTYLTFDNTGSYQHSIGEDAQAKYYWIRHKKITPSNIPRYSAWHPTSATGGVTATSTIPEIFYSVTVRSDAQIFTANSSSVIQSPDTIKFTATKNALSGAFVWSTSPSVNLYAAVSGGSATTSGSVIYLRKGDFSGDTVSVTVTVDATTAEEAKGANDTYFETVAIPRVDSGGGQGADAKSVRLRSSSFIFKEATDGTVTPDYIQLDAVKQNTTATANWAVTDDSPSVSLRAGTASNSSVVTTGNTVYLHKGDFSTNTAVTVTLTCDSIVDITSIVQLEENSGNIVAVLSNPMHVLPADNDGAVSNSQATGSGTNIRIYEGTTALTFVTGTPGAGEWAVSVGNTANITEGGVTDQGTYATIADHTGVATGTDKYTITYTISGKTRKADSFTNFTVDQFLTKAKAGGIGPAGYNNATVNLFKINNDGSTAPALPDSGSSTYTFATKALTETTSGDWDGWTPTRPATTSSNKFRWVTAATASSNTTTDTIPYSEWVTAVTDSGEGFQTATIYLYIKNSSATSPAKPDGNLTYTFSTKTISGSNFNSWLTAIPTSGGTHTHVTTATALAVASVDTDTIATGDWATPSLLAGPGATGSSAKTVIVTPSSYTRVKYTLPVDYGEDSTFYVPTSITIKGQTQNTTTNGAWSTSAGTLTSIVNTHNGPPSCAVTSANFVDGMVVTYTLHGDDGGGLDSVTLEELDAATDAITTILTNETHAMIANSDGSVSNSQAASSGTDIKVYQGASLLDYLEGSSANGKWQLTVGNIANITEGGKSSQGSSGSRFARVEDHTGVATGTDTYAIPYTIAGKNTIGTSINITKVQTLTKAKGGATGASAALLNVSSSSATFAFDNSSDTTPTPSTVTITASQQNQASDLVTGDLAVTNGSKSTGSYSGSSGTGTYTWVVTPSGTYPVTCVVTNDSLSGTVIINKVVGGDIPAGLFTTVWKRAATKPTSPANSTVPPSGWYTTWTAANSAGNVGHSMWQMFGSSVALNSTTYDWHEPFLWFDDYDELNLIPDFSILDPDDITFSWIGNTITFDWGTGFNAIGPTIPNTLLNSSITINANGTLSGAGSGQVTGSGLGFTGNTYVPYIYTGTSTPNAGAAGDLWIDTTSSYNQIKRSTGSGTGNWATLNPNKNAVGLGNVDNDSTSTIRSGTTAANVGLSNVTNESKSTMFAGPTFTGTVAGVTSTHVGLSNVPNVDMRNMDNATGGTLAVGRGGTGLTANTTWLNSNTTATDVGLSNVPNVDMRNLDNVTGGTLAVGRGGTGLTANTTWLNSNTTATDVGLSNVPNVDMRNMDNATSGSLPTSRTAATDNGTKINTAGNIAGTINVESGASITVGNITIDGTKDYILITD